ncbi:MAG: MotA/TolQ/ExbB proton channel family protein [Proteobacteria bacterium]|nr:MotA/TolQ/ExbB proton channel family protein [Pseudomonadota bacterium]
MLTERLLRLTIAGGSEWVMALLLALSVISISVVVERALFFRRRRRQLDRVDRALLPLLSGAAGEQLRQAVEELQDPLLTVALESARTRDPADAEKIVASLLSRERLELERRLTFLGTLGNNAPFIGLFGTVLGIIRAFNDLSVSTRAGSSAVMAGISEALVATAIGLFVAIPAVIAFNYFQRQVDRLLSTTEALSQALLASARDVGAGLGTSSRTS